jgi:hypothetical protein
MPADTKGTVMALTSSVSSLAHDAAHVAGDAATHAAELGKQAASAGSEAASAMAGAAGNALHSLAGKLPAAPKKRSRYGRPKLLMIAAVATAAALFAMMRRRRSHRDSGVIDVTTLPEAFRDGHLNAAPPLEPTTTAHT